MATYEFEQSESLSGGSQWLSKPGKYHGIVTSVDFEPATKDGKPIDGIQVTGEILDGTEPSEKGKEFNFVMWKPERDDKEKAEKANRVLTHFSYAMGFINSHEAGQKCVIDGDLCEGRQLVMNFTVYKEKLRLNFHDIYHVDDPAVAEVPKSANALAAIPKSLRKAAAPAAKAKSTKELATVGAPNLDDI